MPASEVPFCPCPGLLRPVSVRRDAFGIPHLLAESDSDLFHAFGWVMAQDRAWQMDWNRRSALGRLSEVQPGAPLLAADKLFRTLNLQQIAGGMYAALDAETRLLLEAFTDGVNAWIASHEDHGLTFGTLGYRMEPWRATDSLAILRLMGWMLAADFEKELFAWDLARTVGPQLAAQLYPTIPAPHVQAAMRAVYPAADGDPEVDQASGLPEWARGGRSQDQGTNIWVLNGSRTASGRPLLANDPHLNLSAPGIWYEVHLRGDTLHVTGFAFPGLPMIAIGHNGHVAWGAANWSADSQDLFIEQLSKERTHYKANDGSWAPLTVREEVIQVRESEPVHHQVAETPRGPLLRVEHDGSALALAWTGFSPTAEIACFLRACRSRDVQEWQEAFAGYGCPPQNYYAFDIHGRIAGIHAGQLPYRARGESSFPQDAHDPTAAWAGLIPESELHRPIDEGTGWLGNANNKPLEAAAPTGCRFTLPYRYRRIVELISARSGWTPEQTVAMQGDTRNLAAVEFLAALRTNRQHHSPEWSDPRYYALWARLLEWNGDHRDDLSACSLWHVFSLRLAQSLIQPLIGDALWQRYQDQPDPQQVLLLRWLAEPQAAPWERDSLPAALRLQHAFELAIVELSSLISPDPDQWGWDQLHALRLPHPAGLRGEPWAVEPVPMPGGRHTLNVANANPSQGWHCNHGVSLRFVAWQEETGRIRSQAIVPPGMGGDPASPHFADQLALFAAGELREMPFYPEELVALPVVLQLVPADGEQGSATPDKIS